MQNKKRFAVFVAALSAGLGFLAVTTPLYAASSEQVLYAFQGGKSDGVEPLAGVILTPLEPVRHHLRRRHLQWRDCFRADANNGQWTEKVLHTFQPKYGERPKAGLIMDSAGNLYGTTYYGGAYNGGIVFELTPNNGQWTFKVLHGFIDTGKDGLNPALGSPSMQPEICTARPPSAVVPI